MVKDATENRGLISVIVPVYNAGAWLSDALDSLRTQTYGHFEAILIDDGSTDDSGEICRRVCSIDSRFRLVSRQNEGVSAARNHGIDIAGGEWISFMDADDLLLPDSLEVLVSAAASTGCRIVAGGFTKDMTFHVDSGKGEYEVMTSDQAIITGLYQKKILNNPWGMLFHSSVFKGKTPLRFRKCRYEDLDLFYRAFEQVDKVCVTDRTVYLYRDNPDSFINTWSEARLDALDVTDRIVEHMQKRGGKLLRAAKDRRFSAHFNMLVEMERHHIDNPGQRARCLKVIREQRSSELLDRNVRLKNKIGALVSYLGMPAIRLICRF